MIYEQAFYNLPEILVGAGYLEQDFEGGITGAFVMAVLLELNGRNVNNPMSRIKLEHRYRPPHGVTTRGIRTDMFLDTTSLNVATARLDAYGWRHENYLEAKFIRGNNVQTSTRAELAVDLTRLACLPTSMKAGKDIAGRYLLHVYGDDPDILVGGKKTANGSLRKGFQQYMVDLRQPGLVSTTVDISVEARDGVLNKFPGTLANLKLAIDLRTLEIKPQWATGTTQYWCYLSRIEAVKVEIGARWFSIAKDRVVAESAVGDRNIIWSDVYQHLDP